MVYVSQWDIECEPESQADKQAKQSLSLTLGTQALGECLLCHAALHPNFGVPKNKLIQSAWALGWPSLFKEASISQVRLGLGLARDQTTGQFCQVH